jgi:hypothetical protein
MPVTNIRWKPGGGNPLHAADGTFVAEIATDRLGFKKTVNLAAASQALTADQSGQKFVGAVDAVFTLPAADAATKGVWYEFETGALSAGTGLSISPAAADHIRGNGLTVGRQQGPDQQRRERPPRRLRPDLLRRRRRLGHRERAGHLGEGSLSVAGSTTTTHYALGALRRIQVDWTADAAAATVPNTVLPAIEGELLAVETNPGAVAPTDNYDFVLNDAEGLDKLNGAGQNRDTTTTEIVYSPRSRSPRRASRSPSTRTTS